MVNQPRRPRSHVAAARAPRAKVPRSRTVCVSVIVSDGASKPTVCVPGIDPARVAATSMARGKPDDSSARFSDSAVPLGASRFAAWCSSWSQAP